MLFKKGEFGMKWLFLVVSLLCLLAGFFHIPILSWCGVDVFVLRGILIFTCLPVIAVSAIPLAIFLNKYCFKKNSNKRQ